jgi:hypothetical protein
MKSKCRLVARNLPGLLALACLLGAAFALTAARPSLAQGDDEAWTPITVIYTSDIKGQIEPCG